MLRRVVARKWAVLAVLALAVIGVVFAQRQSDGGGLLGTTSTTAGNYINRISIRMTGAGTTSLSVTPADGSDGKYTNSTSGALNCLYGYGISAASSSVRVTAAPAAGYRFSGWGSYTPANAGEGSVVCSGTTANPCTVNAGAWPILVPNFVPLTAPTATPAPSGPLFLNVTGLGTVTSAPAGVNCTGTANGTNCNPNLNPGTSYTLTAAPAAGQVFKGWTLKCTGTALTCTFNFVKDDVVTAAFGPAPTLSLTVVSYGWVDVSPGGEKCIGLPTGRNCPLPLTPGVSYTLKATPAADMAFAGWGGNRCTGAATTCTFAFAVNDTVTASFQPQGKLTVALTRPSTGYISLTGANNLAAKCGKGADGVDSSQCSVQVFPGDSVILTRTVQSPDPAFAFDSWAITPAPATPCSTTSAVCTVFVNSNTTIAAKFKLVSALNIVSAPPGAPYTPSCPANYQQAPQDMNEGVGSDFVFLCYSLNFSSAVKSIGAMNTDNAANKCQTNATKLNGNMNKGATAKLGMAEATEIYLCYDYASAYDAWNGHSAFEALKAVKFDSEPNGNSVCASLGSAWAPVAWDYLTPISGSGGAVQNASANGVSANMNYGAAKGNAWGKFIYICGYEIQVPGSR